MTIAFLVLTGLAAIADWVAVQQRLFRLEYILKPLTLVLLIVAAAAADLGPAHPWVVVGLVLGLIGDIALLRSDKNHADHAFLAGLGAYLAGNLVYIGGFLRQGVRGIDLLAGALVLLGASVLVMPAILRGARKQAGTRFAGLVGAYAAAVGLMAMCAVGTGLISTAVGGALFATSDTVLGYHRFVRRLPYGDVAIMATYHAAQFLIVVGLIRAT